MASKQVMSSTHKQFETVQTTFQVPLMFKLLSDYIVPENQLPTSVFYCTMKDKALKSWSHTQSKMISFAHTWTIDNFSFLCDVNQNEQSSICSSTFSPNIGSSQFYLELYPKGSKPENKDHLSVYLCLKSCRTNEITVQYNISLINQTGEKQFTTESQKKFVLKTNKDDGWGYPKYITIAHLLDHKSQLLPDDTLTIYCELKLLTEPVTISGENEIEFIDTGLITDLENIWHSKKLHDVVLMVGERELHAHKAILAARSPVFAVMFESEVHIEAGQHQTVHLTDIESDVCEEMLRYIYCGQIRAIESMASELLVAADKYLLDRLKWLCEQYLSSKLTVQNVGTLLVLADTRGADELKANAIGYICSNSFSATERNSLREAIKARPNLFEQIYYRLASNVHLDNSKVNSILTSELTESRTHNETKLVPLVHKWTIDNMSHYWNWNDHKTEYPYIESNQFGLPDNQRVQFRLRLYPKGSAEDNKNHVSVVVDLLASETNNQKKSLQIKLSIINGKGHKCNTEDSKIVRLSDHWEWPKYVTHANLKDQSKSLLPKDRFTLFCEIQTIVKPTQSETDKETQLCISQALHNIWQKRELCDVVLNIGSIDGQELEAHKAILGARSTVFAAMFEHDTIERTSNKVNITDVDVGVFEDMLTFIYTGKLSSSERLSTDLLIAADKYALDALKRMCEQWLCGKLSPDTATDLLVLADTYSAHHLKTKAVEYINFHLSQVMATKGWQTIKKRPEVFDSLLYDLEKCLQ